MSILSAVAIIVLIIIVIGVIVVVSNHNNRAAQQQPQLPQFQNLGGTVPSQFNNILTQPSLQATQSLAALSATRLSNTTEFSISYKP